MQVTNDGTLNATAAGRTAYGVRGVVSATRSAGANDLTNIGVYCTASGGQINYALYTDVGDVRFNAGGGTATFVNAVEIGGALNVVGAITEAGITVLKGSVGTNTIPKGNGTNVLGNSTITDTGSLVTVTNALKVTGAADFDSTLNVDGAAVVVGDLSVGGVPYYSHKLTVYGDAVATGLKINASAGGNETGLTTDGGSSAGSSALVIANAASTVLATFKYGGEVSIPGALSVDGVLDVNNDLAKFGSGADGLVFIKEEVLGFRYASNATATGYINFNGYQGGTTQFRDLIIADGRVSGINRPQPARATTAALSVDGNCTLGNATTDSHTVNGNVTINENAAGPVTALTLENTDTGATTSEVTIDFKQGNALFQQIAAKYNSGGGGQYIAFNLDAGGGGAPTERMRIDATGKLTVTGEVEIDGALNHDGTTVGFYGTAPGTQSTIAALTDNTTGTANDTLEALTSGTVYATDVAAIRNNFADLAAKINEFRTALRNVGLLA